MMDELTKQLLKLPEQLKEMHETHQQRQNELCELYNRYHPTVFYPTCGEINYVGNQKPGQYQNNNFPQSNNFNQ